MSNCHCNVNTGEKFSMDYYYWIENKKSNWTNRKRFAFLCFKKNFDVISTKFPFYKFSYYLFIFIVKKIHHELGSSKYVNDWWLLTIVVIQLFIRLNIYSKELLWFFSIKIHSNFYLDNISLVILDKLLFIINFISIIFQLTNAQLWFSTSKCKYPLGCIDSWIISKNFLQRFIFYRLRKGFQKANFIFFSFLNPVKDVWWYAVQYCNTLIRNTWSANTPFPAETLF